MDRDNPQMSISPEMHSCDDVNRSEDSVMEIDPMHYGMDFDKSHVSSPPMPNETMPEMPGMHMDKEY